MSSGRRGVVAAGAPGLVAAIGLLVLAGCSSSGSDQSPLQVSGLSATPSATTSVVTSVSPTSAAGSASGTTPSSGGSGASAAPGSTAASGSSAAPASLPPAVAGFSYLDPPATATAAFSKLSGAFPGVFGVPVVRTVKQENNSVGTVGFLPLSAASRAAGTEGSVVQGLVEGMSGKGYTITTQPVGSHKLVLATSKQGTIVAWYRDGVVAVVTTTNPPSRPVAFATAALS